MINKSCKTNVHSLSYDIQLRSSCLAIIFSLLPELLYAVQTSVLNSQGQVTQLPKSPKPTGLKVHTLQPASQLLSVSCLLKTINIHEFQCTKGFSPMNQIQVHFV